MLLIEGLSSAIIQAAEAQAHAHELEDVTECILEPRPIEEGKE